MASGGGKVEEKQRRREYMQRWNAKRQAERMAGPQMPCGCGCGEMIPAIRSDGKPAQFKSGHNAPEHQFQPGHGLLRKTPVPRGADSPNWKGGRPQKSGKDTRFQPGHAPLRKTPVPRGPENPNWKGGEATLRKGYVRAWITPEQAALWPTGWVAKNSHYILRSHKVWNEAHPDDFVQKGEEVHHENEIRDDDRPENLRKMTSAEHDALHWRKRKKHKSPHQPQALKSHAP